jgi:hypothetical protein
MSHFQPRIAHRETPVPMLLRRTAHVAAEYAQLRTAMADAVRPNAVSLVPGAAEGDTLVMRGVVTVLDTQSPWHGGLFAFTLRLAPSYPMSTPAAAFDAPLSHVALAEGLDAGEIHRRTVDLAPVCDAIIDPRCESVLLRSCQHLSALFSVVLGEDDASLALRSAARLDVTVHGTAPDDLTDAAYVDVLLQEAAPRLAVAAAAPSPSWFAAEFLGFFQQRVAQLRTTKRKVVS